MKILVACELSGTVRDAFIKQGHNAMSCDILPTETPGPHYQGDVMDILGDGWDMLLAFPPCTYLCSSGLHWNKRRPERTQETEKAAAFFLRLTNADIKMIAIENPVGCMSTRYRKPDQIIQPWQFGHDASKSTCLWLKNLAPLKSTARVNARMFCKACGLQIDEHAGEYGCCGDGARYVWGNQTTSGQNKLGPSPERAKLRAKTYQGIADAMAAQWGQSE